MKLVLSFLLLSSALTPLGAAQEFEPWSFRNPPVEFYPAVFWVWNDRMTPQKIREQLAEMHDHRVLTVCILPEPPEFRPDTMGNQLDVDYLSDSYFERYKLAMDEVKKLGMKAWLYDEGGWPSGNACGRVLQSDPSLAAQTLITERRPLKPGEVVGLQSGAVSTFVENGHTLVICRVERSNFQVDHLNPAATRRFIELTHEGYRRFMPEYLGSLIPWAFTDEPAVPYFVPGKQMPWTDALPGLFRQEKGYDLIESLPLLLSNPPLQTAAARRARIDFFEVWSRLFQQAYLLPIRDWCRKYGLLSGGHFGGDDETMGSATYGYGHILRAMRGLDLPGVDTIWRQLFPGQHNHYFPRYAGSVARQQGLRRVLTESFAVYGNGLTLAEMKWLTDYQYVRGCNTLVMSAYPAGTEGHLMSGERPHFGPASPLWRYQPVFQDYAARLGYVLSRGEGATDVALYFPVRDLWAAAPAQSTPEALANDEVARTLEEHQVDFDFVDDDLLKPEAVVNGVLHAGNMSYRTLVFSLARLMPDQSARSVAQFVRSGGTLIAVGSLPETGPSEPRSFLHQLGTTAPHMGEERRVDTGRIAVVSLDQLMRWVRPTLLLEPATESLRVTSRRLHAGMIYLITNESDSWVETSLGVPVPPGMAAKICDAETGRITRAPHRLRLAPWGSTSLLVDRSAAGAERVEPDIAGASPVQGNWEVHRVSQTAIDGDDFIEKTLPSDPWHPATLGDWKNMVGADFSGTAEYRVSFLYGGAVGQDHSLDLGTVATAAEVRLNGEKLGERAWPPYRFHTGKALRKGRNELRVRVTNTLANYLVSPGVRAAWAARTGPGWPGHYDARAHGFEEQSTTSGLLGPVRLLELEPENRASFDKN
jgi:hypothetical protein